MDTVMSMWDRIRDKDKIKPNQMLLNTVFEASIRLKDSDRMV